VTPGYHTDFPERDGNGYIDKNVQAGQTYQYQVQAVGLKSGPTGLSAKYAATHPTSSMSVPNITYTSTAGNSDLDDFMRNTVLPFLRTWYPKAANLVAYPDYKPFSSYTVTFGPNGAGAAAVTSLETGMISADAAETRKDEKYFLTHIILHESVHTIQGGPGGASTKTPGWILETVADSVQQHFFRSDDMIVPRSDYNKNNYYTNGYDEGIYFLDWLQQTRDSGYGRKLTVKSHSNTLTSADLQLGGVSLEQLYSTLVGDPVHTGTYVNRGSKYCVDSPDGTIANGTSLRIWGCNGSIAQQITSEPYTWYDNTTVLHMLSNCLSVDNNGTADGTAVKLVDCLYSANTKTWNIMPDGSIVGAKSGKCLTSASNSQGAGLVISACNGSDQQKWNIPANSPHLIGLDKISFKSNASKCLDDPAGSTTDDTQPQVWDCNGQSPQAWSLLRRADGTLNISVLGLCLGSSAPEATLYSCFGDLYQQWRIQPDGSLKNVLNGLCLDTSTKTATNAALLVVATCNGGASQLFNFPATATVQTQAQPRAAPAGRPSDIIR
jgi:hypothetical protein